MSADELTKERVVSSHAGAAAALERKATEARQRAGEFYGRRKDDIASLWREVADWLDAEAVVMRGRQKKAQQGESSP